MGKLSLVGISYGGFVGYSVAALYPEMVEKVVICCSGVCVEEKDFRDGLLRVSDLEEATKILVPQKPEKLKELVAYSFFRPPPLRLMLTCLLNDFIEVRASFEILPFHFCFLHVGSYLLLLFFVCFNKYKAWGRTNLLRGNR